MSDYLLIGDPHVKLDNLQESLALILWLARLCNDRDLTPVFMGDQYDSHAIARVEVMELWQMAFDQFKNRPIAIDGNHDMDMSGTHSLMISHRRQVKWISIVDGGDRSFQLSPELPHIGVLPFFRSNGQFIEEAQTLVSKGCKLILCHQEFNGAKYDNGFYAPNGVNLDDIPGVAFISGHLHTRQALGNRCFYLGTPRQLTVSDAGQEKGVWVFSPTTFATEFIPTPVSVCEPFTIFNITPDSDKVKIPDSPKSIVRVSGPKEFCQKMATKLPPSVRAMISPESETVLAIKESDGINVAFAKFLSDYWQKHGIIDLDGTVVAAKIYDKCPLLR